MIVVMGGTGHVGSAVARSLLGRDEAITIVTDHTAEANSWQVKGGEIAEADID